MSTPVKTKRYLVQKFTNTGLIVISIALVCVGYKTVVGPWFKHRKLAQAEEFANIVYEQRKRTTQQSDET